jgi:hypothetical protein
MQEYKYRLESRNMLGLHQCPPHGAPGARMVHPPHGRSSSHQQNGDQHFPLQRHACGARLSRSHFAKGKYSCELHVSETAISSDDLTATQYDVGEAAAGNVASANG